MTFLLLHDNNLPQTDLWSFTVVCIQAHALDDIHPLTSNGIKTQKLQICISYHGIVLTRSNESFHHQRVSPEEANSWLEEIFNECMESTSTFGISGLDNAKLTSSCIPVPKVSKADGQVHSQEQFHFSFAIFYFSQLSCPWEQITDTYNFKEERFHLAHIFRRFSP